MTKFAYFNEFNRMDAGTKISCDYVDGKGNQMLITISGDMESHFARQFTNAMSALFAGEKNLRTVLLDLGAVNYISSNCISSFLQLIHHAGLNDLEMYFVNPRPHMQDLIDTMGIGHFVKKIKLAPAKTLAIKCVKCRALVEVKALGKIKCPACGAHLVVSEKGLGK